MINEVTAYPLQWPRDWRRTDASSRANGRFKKYDKYITISVAATRLTEELNRMGIPRDDVVISTNIQLRLDGMPRSDDKKITDPGAAVYWRDGGVTRCMAVDQYTDVAQNIAALAATIEAMRAIERHGGATILNRAFAGFEALPAPGALDWRGVLGIESKSPTPSEIESAYKRQRSRAHPDKGGSETWFNDVERAYAEARASNGRT
jgi:hypothetical protein